jgi:hypothetical protein
MLSPTSALCPLYLIISTDKKGSHETDHVPEITCRLGRSIFTVLGDRQFLDKRKPRLQSMAY